MQILDRLRINSEDFGACRVWTGYSANGRYGHLRINGVRVAAHIASFEHFKRPLKPGEKVLHNCDQGFCIEPSHLFAGTQRDNVMDMLRKRRGGRQKISHEQAEEIRHMSPKAAAAKFRLHVNHVNAIQRRRYWSHAQ